MRCFTIRRVLGKSYSCLRYLSDLFGQQGFHDSCHIYSYLSCCINCHFLSADISELNPYVFVCFFEHGQHEFLCSNFNVVCSPHVKTIPKVFFASTSLIQWNPRSEEVAGKRRIYIYIFVYHYIYIYITNHNHQYININLWS